MRRFSHTVKRTLIPGSMSFLIAGLAVGVVLLNGGALAGQFGRAWLTGLLALYGVLSVPIVATALIEHLGGRYGSIETAADARGATVLVVIGNGSVHYATGDLTSDQLTRRSVFCVFEAVRLYHVVHPDWIVASGGTGQHTAAKSESELIRDQLAHFGVPAERIVLESTSRTTDEQASNVVRILHSRGWSGPIVVVTTAAHMPRVMTFFEQRSIDAVGSVARDLRYDDRCTGWRRWTPTAAALRGSESAMYEYLARTYAAVTRHRAQRPLPNAIHQPSTLNAVTTSLIGLLVAIAAIAFGIGTILRLPGLPYNVSELFLDRHLALAIFAVALIWIGAGSMFLAHWLARSVRPYVALPVGVVLLAMISRTLLKYSVTYESLDDILGSNNLVLRVTHEGIWGEAWQRAFSIATVADLATYLERRVRYIALYSPVAVCLALALIPTIRAGRAGVPLGRRYLWWLAASSAVWLWLSKTVTFTWAATDNLTELIAHEGPFDLGGGPFLYLIVVLMAINVALLIRASDQSAYWARAIVFSCVAIPIGWFLLDVGLEQHIQKKELLFAGTQFLLGPDRQHPLSNAALFMRWAVVQTSGVTVMFVGALIAHRLTVQRMYWRQSTATPAEPRRESDVPSSHLVVAPRR